MVGDTCLAGVEVPLADCVLHFVAGLALRLPAGFLAFVTCIGMCLARE
jgi:hypothetical protein